MVLEEKGMGTRTCPVRGLEEKAREDVGWYTEGTLHTIFRLLAPTPQGSTGGTGKWCVLSKRVGKDSGQASVLGWGWVGDKGEGSEAPPASTGALHGVGDVGSKGWMLRGGDWCCLSLKKSSLKSSLICIFILEKRPLAKENIDSVLMACRDR